MDRWNARRQPRTSGLDSVSGSVSDTTGHTSEGGSMAGDPFLVDFGTSINVNEDLRHEIRADIEDIEDSIVAIRGSLRHEENVESTLNTDSSNSHREVANLSRGASEQLETTSVHATLANRLHRTLRDEFVVYTIPTPVTPPPTTPGKNGSRTSLSVGDSVNGTSAVQSNRDVLRDLSGRFGNAASSNREEAGEIDTVIEEQKDAVERKTRIDERVGNEDLQSQLESRRKEIKLEQAEMDKENQKKRAMKDATQKSRVKMGEHDQIITDKTNELDRIKKDNIASDTETSKQVTSAKEKLEDRQKGKSLNESKEAELSSQISYSRDIEDAIKKFKSANTEKNEEYQEQLSQTEKLGQSKAQIVSQLEVSKKQRETAQLNHDDASKAARDADDITSENNNLENSVVVPGRNEISELGKQREQIAKKVEHDSKAIVDDSERAKIEVEKAEDEVEAAKARLSIAKDELDGRQEKRRNYERVHKESLENWERETSEDEVLEKKHRLAYEAELKRNEDMYEAKKRNLDERLQQIESDSDLKCSADDYRFNILSSGAKFIRAAEDTIFELDEDPI